MNDLILAKERFRWRFPKSVQLRLSGKDFSGYFGCTILARSEL